MQKSKIKSIKAREILDSKGMPTVEVELKSDDGVFKASVPSGVSTGKYEAVELRDADGRGVKRAIENIEKIIAPVLKKEDITDQRRIDDILIQLDGTRNKSRLGGNAILPVSIAVLRAGAVAKKLPLWKWISKIAGTRPKLPSPCILQIEGGLHAKESSVVQEFMIVPRADSFKNKFKQGSDIFRKLKIILKKKYGSLALDLGQEGAFTPPVKKTEEVLDLIMEAIGKIDAELILDVAASSFLKKGKYYFDGERLKREELLNFYLKICKKYPILAIEDPFSEEDWTGFQKITKILGKKITIVGDDLLVTNFQRVKKAINKRACNGLILKPNQIGTVSEAIGAAKLAMKNKWKVFVKHRGGETMDDFIADLSVGLGTGFIMAGAPSKPERMVKYDRLVRIEEEIHPVK